MERETLDSKNDVKTVQIKTDDEAIKVKIVSKTSFSDIVKGWVPIFVSVLALYSTIVQLQKIREYQRISVSPLLSFYLQDSHFVDRFGLWIENHGLGPAIIDSVIFYVDEERIDCDEPSRLWDNAFAKLRENGVYLDDSHLKKIYKEWYVPGYALKADAETVFFALPEAFTMEFDESAPEEKRINPINLTVMKVLMHLDIKIYYKSFFGEADSVLFENEKLK